MSTLKVNSIIPTGGVPTGGGGGIIQMKQTVKTGDFSAAVSTGNYSIITGLSVSLTPLSTSSKILLHAVIVGSNSGDNVHTGFEIRNGSTRLTDYQYTGTLGSRTPTMSSTRNDSTSVLFTVPIYAQDSPASTSQQTYNVYVSVEGYTFYLNKGQNGHDQAQNYCGISTITAFEVSA
tara:strand:- start:1750 stop:2280 length:531 start_codon:yes stop_codon:yes gene_type:complete